MKPPRPRASGSWSAAGLDLRDGDRACWSIRRTGPPIPGCARLLVARVRSRAGKAKCDARLGTMSRPTSEGLVADHRAGSRRRACCALQLGSNARCLRRPMPIAPHPARDGRAIRCVCTRSSDHGDAALAWRLSLTNDVLFHAARAGASCRMWSPASGTAPRSTILGLSASGMPTATSKRLMRWPDCSSCGRRRWHEARKLQTAVASRWTNWPINIRMKSAYRG